MSESHPFRRLVRRLRPRGRPAAQARCSIEVDGVRIWAMTGQNLAAALVQAGIWRFGRHPVSGEPRGPYCGMGVCFECEVAVDGGGPRRACMTGVREGLIVHTEPYLEGSAPR